MKLDKTLNPFLQFAAAKSSGSALIADLLGERMGDKAAFIQVAAYIAKVTGQRIALCEASEQGMSDFSLKDFENSLEPLGISVMQMPPNSDLNLMGLDIHTLGLGGEYESLWSLNAYLYTTQQRVTLKNPYRNPSGEVVLCLLEDTKYNERRDMDVDFIIENLDSLFRTFKKLRVLGTTRYNDSRIEVLPFDKALDVVMNAELVISGDTGFSHVAALFGIPLIAVYPDWVQFGIARMSKSIILSDWWKLPLTAVSPVFLPNAEYELMKVVQLGTDHKFSLDSLFDAATELLRLSRARNSSLEAVGATNEASAPPIDGESEI